MNRQCNARGIALIKNFEKCRLKAYPDQGGIPTIGWGHTGPEVALGQTITQEQADALFAQDLREKAELPISRLVTVPLTSNQHAALCAFVFNIGEGAFAKSTLLRVLNSAQYSAVPVQLVRWNKVKGEVSAGLVNRREAELQLWLTPDDVGA